MRHSIGMVFIVSISVVLASCASLARAAEKENLKVVNWNVLYGFNHKESIDLGVGWINRQNPHVVTLQELNGNSLDSLKTMAGQWGHDHAVILKEHGFPVGLTSDSAIEVLERRVKGFHHGFLHCKTHGIHFFVVHFWPGKDHEAAEIIRKIKPLLAKGEQVIVAGDFNAYSRNDETYLAKRKKTPQYNVVNLFEENGFVDLVHKHDKTARYSFPSPIIIPRWAKTMEEVEARRGRIDFVFADRALQKSSVSGTILTSEELDKVSDHYPVVVEFERLK